MFSSVWDIASFQSIVHSLQVICGQFTRGVRSCVVPVDFATRLSSTYDPHRSLWKTYKSRTTTHFWCNQNANCFISFDCFINSLNDKCILCVCLYPYVNNDNVTVTDSYKNILSECITLWRLMVRCIVSLLTRNPVHLQFLTSLASVRSTSLIIPDSSGQCIICFFVFSPPAHRLAYATSACNEGNRELILILLRSKISTSVAEHCISNDIRYFFI